MPPVVFEPTISTGEWPQTYALNHAAAGTGNSCLEHTHTHTHTLKQQQQQQQQQHQQQHNNADGLYHA
jgi:hypothetical protein